MTSVFSSSRSARARVLTLTLALVVAALSLLSSSPARADGSEGGDDGSAVQQIVAAQLEEHSGGTVVGNEIRYDGGVTFVAVPDGVFSLAQCTSGRFCGWSSPNYSGSFYWVTGSGTKSLSWTAASYSNKRSGIARLYNAGGTASLCFAPGRSRSTVGASYHNPDKVTLGSVTSC
ncbi:MAG: peptidase inhibitor family I36 protein [Nocardioidaceae bacterium]